MGHNEEAGRRPAVTGGGGKPQAEADFNRQVSRSLEETERQAITSSGQDRAGGWQRARMLVEHFKPVPWFIWRLANFTLSQSGRINKINDGMVYGLKRLLCAAAADPTLSLAEPGGKPAQTARDALAVLPSDVVAALSVIYAVSRRLEKQQFERVWRPILDDAIVRAQIGYYVGCYNESFGAGRGMLAGYAGRVGLAVIISNGDVPQAKSALEMLAAGKTLKEVGEAVYACDPLQMSAMVLSAAGCGRDAAFGTVAYASRRPEDLDNEHQRAWLAAFIATDHLRTNTSDKIEEPFWELLKITSLRERVALKSKAAELAKKGHTWEWLR